MTNRSATPQILLVADFTIAGLTPFLEGGDAPHLSAILAPFDQVTQVLRDARSPCWNEKPETAFVWTRPQTAIRSFARVLDHEPVTIDEVLNDVDDFVHGLCEAASRVASLFVATWTLPSYERSLGTLNWNVERGPAYFLARMNLRLAESLSSDSRVHVLDAGRWVARVGPSAASPKLWHLAKIAFGPAVFQEAASDLKAAVRALRGPTKKLVIVDLDDTIWGGVVGDVGWQNLRLGGHDPVGEAFLAFQRALKRLTNRGILLAIVSKNTETVALEAIDSHPEMFLRRQDFVGWRVNWDDKATNIAALVDELQLGLDAVVFIDDSPAERARVRGALPQVLVPEWPADQLIYEQALAELTCFETLTLSAEDQSRTRMYLTEQERNRTKAAAQSMDDYLRSLELVVSVEGLGPENLSRAAQLLNKTNQMNLTTRRLTEDEFSKWSAVEGRHTFVVRVSDRFDDYGLTGIASLSTSGGTATVVDFLLSCRVMGRGVEEAMLSIIIDRARAAGASRLDVPFSSTPKNSPMRMFLDERSGLRREADGSTYTWDLSRDYQGPSHVSIQFS